MSEGLRFTWFPIFKHALPGLSFVNSSFRCCFLEVVASKYLPSLCKCSSNFFALPLASKIKQRKKQYAVSKKHQRENPPKKKLSKSDIYVNNPLSPYKNGLTIKFNKCNFSAPHTFSFKSKFNSVVMKRNYLQNVLVRKI